MRRSGSRYYLRYSKRKSKSAEHLERQTSLDWRKQAYWSASLPQSSITRLAEEVQVPLSSNQARCTCRQLGEEQSTQASLRTQDALDLLRRDSRGQHRRELGACERLQETLLEQVECKQLTSRAINGTQGQSHLRCVVWGSRLACADSVQHWREHHVDVPLETCGCLHEEVRSGLEREDRGAVGRSIVPSIYWDTEVHSVPWHQGGAERSLLVSDSSSWAVVRTLQARQLQRGQHQDRKEVSTARVLNPLQFIQGSHRTDISTGGIVPEWALHAVLPARDGAPVQLPGVQASLMFEFN